MKCLLALVLVVAGLASPSRVLAQPSAAKAIIHAQPLHAGRINPRLFGNFIELLDDVVPGLWAQMLNDRSFEGVKRVIDPVYFDGAPSFCDREWDQNSSWSRDTENPFNGTRSAKLVASRQQPASLTQSGLATKRGATYLFSGWLRADQKVPATILLKALLPSGEWMTLGSAKLPPLSSHWTKYAASLESAGETDRAVFELRVEEEGTLRVDKVSLMRSDNLKGWRPDVVAAIKDLQLTVIRWGGSVCDPGEYRWQEGVGERDARVPFTNKNWGRIDPNDVGIDEFCQLCELTGTEPLVCHRSP